MTPIIKWLQSQAIIAETEHLKAELNKGGVDDLTEKIKLLVNP